jgi:hypothetical protein
VKKILLHSAVAVIVGLSLTLIPLFTVAEIKAHNDYSGRSPFTNGLEALEGTYGLSSPQYSADDLKIFIISFVIALIAYVLVKHRMPSHRDREWVRLPPF